MPLPLDPRALAQAQALQRKELLIDTIAPACVGVVALLWLDLAVVVAWYVLYAVALHTNRAAYRRWTILGMAPSRSKLALMGFALAVSYTLLPWALVLQGASTANVVGLVMVFSGALRAVQDFALGRGPGFAAVTPYLFPAVAPSAMSFAVEPNLATAAAMISTTSLFIYMSVFAMQQVKLRQQLVDEADRAEAERQKAVIEKVRAESIINTPLLSLAILDTDLRYCAVSTQFLQRTGVARDQVIGKTLKEALPWAPDRWAEANARALAGERVGETADRITLPNGETIWSTWENAPLYDEEGRIVGVVCYDLNVSDIMRARSDAETSAKLLSLALEVGHSAVYEIDLREKRIVFDAHSERLFGRPVSFEDLDAWSNPHFYDEDRPALDAAFTAAAKGELELTEHRFRHSVTGQVCWLRSAYRLLRDENGRARRVLVMVTDATERRERVEAFATALTKAERLLDRRRALLEIVSRELGIEPMAPAAPSPTGPSAHGEAMGVANDLAAMTSRLSRLLAEIGARDAALAELITVLSDARRQAEASNNAKSQFLANMSHELRTPLNAIIGYTEILMEVAEAEARETDLADLKRVLAASKRLLALINEVLDLSKIEAGRMEMEHAPFDVAAMAQAAADTVRIAAAANGNALKVTIASDVGRITGDSFRLSQCVLNLLSNAAKFTKDGVISLTVARVRSREEDTLQITVADTGIGISPEAQSRIFSPFTQADASTTRAFGGTGLGLTITKRLVELMGGAITLTSAVGRGSAFTITVPATATGAAVHQNPERHGPSVLIIDPDPHARDLAARSLGRLGLSAAFAADAAEARAFLAQERPALVILDVMLPDGIEAGEALLRDITTQDAAPVIVASSLDDRHRLTELGACTSLVKPVSRERLCAAALQFARRHDEASAEDAAQAEKTAAEAAAAVL